MSTSVGKHGRHAALYSFCSVSARISIVFDCCFSKIVYKTADKKIDRLVNNRSERGEEADTCMLMTTYYKERS